MTAVRSQLSVALLCNILLKRIFSGQDNKKGCVVLPEFGRQNQKRAVRRPYRTVCFIAWKGTPHTETEKRKRRRKPPHP